MEQVQGTHKALKFATEDVISNMPDNVIGHIMDRLPIKDAVRTGILSRNWRFHWTLLTKPVFNAKFFEPGLHGQTNCNERTISNILLYLKGNVTKFFLCIPRDKKLDVEDVSRWVMFLSRREIQEFTLINTHKTPLKLPSHFFSCLDLQHLELFNCCFHIIPTFGGFPNLSTLAIALARTERGEFINWCPLLEKLLIFNYYPIGRVKLISIAKLQNLRILLLPLNELVDTPITSSDIYKLVGFLPKLKALGLDFLKYRFLVEGGGRKEAPAAFPCLKNVGLFSVNFGCANTLSFVLDMIWGFPNLQTLKIYLIYKDAVPPPLLVPSEVDYSRMRKLQLKNVAFFSCRGSENEICLIKSLLACSPLLKKISIRANSSQVFGGENGKVMFATRLLKFHRASPIAEVDINWI